MIPESADCAEPRAQTPNRRPHHGIQHNIQSKFYWSQSFKFNTNNNYLRGHTFKLPVPLTQTNIQKFQIESIPCEILSPQIW